MIALSFLVVATPWPFGSVHPLAMQLVTLAALGVAIAATLSLALRGETVILGPLPLWPLVGFLALAVLQLVPIPAGIHALLAPGSASLWHPTDPAAAAVLGPAWRPVSVHPEATRRALAFALGLAALALLSVQALRERRRAQAAAVAVVAAGTAVAIYGIAARAFLGNRLYGAIPVPTVSPFGPFVSKNHFAGYVEMAALLALGLAFGIADESRRSSSPLSWVSSARAGRVLVAFGVAAAMALAVLVSLSRGGVVALAAGALGFVALRALVRRRRRLRRSVALGLTAAAVLAAALVAVLPEEGRARILSLAGITSDQSGAFRLVLWRDTLRAGRASPLVGQGLGAFADALPRFKTGAGILRVEHAESDALELLAETGVAGVGFVLVLVTSFFRALVRGLREQQDRLRRGLGLGAASGLVALLVHSGFDFNLRITSNAALFAFLAAVALAACVPASVAAAFPAGPAPAAAGAGSSPPVRRPALLAASVALLAALAAAVPAPSTSEAALGDEVRRLAGSRQAGALRRLQAEELLSDHLRARPADAQAWLLLAWARAVRAAPVEAAALATHAVRLDPLREELAREAEPLMRLGAGPGLHR